MSKKESGCSFCGRPRAEVGMLIAGVTGHICESCVSQAHTIVKEEDLSSTETKNKIVSLFYFNSEKQSLKPLFMVDQHTELQRPLGTMTSM